MKMNSGKIVKKITAAILLLTILCSALIIPKEVKAEEGFTGELFWDESTAYNNDLARIAAEFCDRAQGASSNKIESTLNYYGIENQPYNYGKSAAFVIGHKEVKIGYKKAIVLVVIARGTDTDFEKIGDVFKGGEKDFLGEKVFDNVYDFEKKVWKGLNGYLDTHPDIKNNQNLKILITGHSLGGATAGMVAARMNYLRSKEEWIDNVEEYDIYCYTFGAIKELTENKNIEKGYENIFNIYNKFDSFGPKGNMSATNASHPKAKFGYTLEYDGLRDKEEIISWNNHLMGNYRAALEKGLVKEVARKMLLDLPLAILENGNSFSEGLLPTTRGYINKKGEIVIPRKRNYQDLFGFSEGLALVDTGDKCGYINKKGKVVIPFKYELPRVNYNDSATYFNEGVVAVMKNYKWGFVNKKGKVVIPLKYGGIRGFSEGLAKVCRMIGDNSCYINKKGKEVIQLNYDWIPLYEQGDFKSGLAVVEKDGVEKEGKYGYINKKGKEVVPLKYNGGYDYKEGLAAVKLGDKWGFINKKGTVAIPIKYDNVGSFSEGLAAIYKEGKCGYINKKGKVVIPFKYDFAGNFSKGLVFACKDGKCGYINKKGKAVIPFKYEWAADFSDGLAAVNKNGKIGFINKKGKLVIPFIYEPYNGGI